MILPSFLFYSIWRPVGVVVSSCNFRSEGQCVVSLDKQLYSTLIVSLSTQVYSRFALTSYHLEVPLRDTNMATKT